MIYKVKEILRTNIPEILLVCKSRMRWKTIAPQHFRVFRILPGLFQQVSSVASSATCIQNFEAMSALNKHLVALINDVSLANCMAEPEMKVRSTYFVLSLVTFRLIWLICRFFSQQYEIQLCKGCRTFRISSYYLFFIFINFLRWCQTYFLLKIKLNNLSE